MEGLYLDILDLGDVLIRHLQPADNVGVRSGEWVGALVELRIQSILSKKNTLLGMFQLERKKSTEQSWTR